MNCNGGTSGPGGASDSLILNGMDGTVTTDVPLHDSDDSMSIGSGAKVECTNDGKIKMVIDRYSDEEIADSTFVLSEGMQRFKARDIGQHLTIYSGSTTGASFGNSVGSTRPCDDVSHVSWQVDRKCHMLSAESMDDLCYYMKQHAGMYTCGDGCEIMASNAKFYNGKDGAPMIAGFAEGELCCPMDVRGEQARGVNEPELVADNMIYKNCE